MLGLDLVTRLEIIGPNGREYIAKYDLPVELSVQDEGRTLKIFYNLEKTDAY